MCYAEFIKLDIESAEFNDFGLIAALLNPEFSCEFYQFIKEKKPLHYFPKMYEFVKNRIWYILVHQQQVKGLFNKWDLKTNPNMTSNLQQSKLRLASLPLTEISCNSSDLAELRMKKRLQQTKHTNDSILIKENLNDSDSNCEERANKLFEDLFGRK